MTYDLEASTSRACQPRPSRRCSATRRRARSILALRAAICCAIGRMAMWATFIRLLNKELDCKPEVPNWVWRCNGSVLGVRAGLALASLESDSEHDNTRHAVLDGR